MLRTNFLSLTHRRRVGCFRSGYTGERCAECAVNYWGNPTEVGGSCERCDCNGNIDMAVSSLSLTLDITCFELPHQEIYYRWRAAVMLPRVSA